MGSEILQEATPTEIGQMALLIFGLGFALLIPFIWVFGRTVALKKGPDERALWTVGLAYAGASLVLIFAGGKFVSAWLAPIITLPSALALYFWQRSTYRKGWVADEDITEGMSLENDDWRIGILIIIALLAAATFKVLVLG